MKKQHVVVLAIVSCIVIAGFVLALSYSGSPAIQAQANPSFDSVTAFLKLEGVDGESTDANHTGWIDILSFDWGLNRTTTRGGAFGYPNIRDFCFKSIVSKASPKLFLACANGKIFKYAVLAVTGKTTADGVVQDFLNITMKNVVISSYQLGYGGQNIQPIDEFCVDFGSITVDYIISDAAGQQHITATWNQVTNQVG